MTATPAALAPVPGGAAGPLRPALTMITGPSGSGRTRALRALRQSAEAAGQPVLELRLAPEDRDEPWHLAAGLLAGLTLPPTRLAAGRARRANPEPPAAMLARALRHHRALTILIDDAQWADPHSAAALLAALHRVDGTSVRAVVTVRTGCGAQTAAGVWATLRQLRAAGLARIAPLRPLTPAESDALAATVLHATPDDAFRAQLRRLGRGRPAALLAAAEGYQGSSAVRVLDRRAYLTDPAAVPWISADHSLLRPVRQLGEDTFAVARALAVLQPLGPAVPLLVGRGTGRTPAQVAEDLAVLRVAGIATSDPQGHWRITVPMLAVALVTGLRPYERRRLAQLAVEAIWAGEATCADPDFLPDQAAVAGRLVDAHRASVLLRTCATAAESTSPAASARWWAGAAELSAAPRDRAEALLADAAAELHVGRHAAAQPSLSRLLADQVGELSAAARQEAELLALARASGADDTGTIQDVAAGEFWGPTRPPPTPVTRAAALALQDRWTQAADLLLAGGSGQLPKAGAGQVDPVTELVATQIAVVTARSRGPVPPVSSAPDTGPARWSAVGQAPPAGAAAGDRRRQVAAALGSYRLAAATGAGTVVDRVLAEAGLTRADLPTPERCLYDWRRGQWTEALEAARVSIAADLVTTRPPVPALVHRAAAEVLLGRGWLTRARAMIDTARTRGIPLPHLTDVVVVDLERALGNTAAAATAAARALATAARSGAVVGTDELWLVTTELAAERGETAAAHAAADAANRAAAALDNGAAAWRAASARLVAGRDTDLAAQVVGLARDLGRPYELAGTLERVVRWTGYRPELLSEAYELYGQLGATLHRSRLRQVMREHGVAVPGRSDTLVEGERLLATLIAEGLSNRELAAVTQSSAKSVEGRLSRLFTRTGYRSRVELAAAVLVGDYRVD
ncbi:AAA family ATPase [Phytohabitans kaempferiae]|uniref:AAA family ATPase n=1 Tax=Phytohabitans kaempferiae TaxID=1620943 RepID=A0ABV6M8C8_9ACTN